MNDLCKKDIELKRLYHLSFLIAVLLGTFLSICLGKSTFCKPAASSVVILQNKINPNYAAAASLERLPGIGLNLAYRIIKYRENFFLQNQNRLPFEKSEDLNNITGIGPKKVEKIRELLTFEKESR